MTPLKSLRAWPLISVNFFSAGIYCVPGPALSWTNLKLGYPATFAVSDSPVEPSTLPTWRFRQEPGGEKQIGPRPCSCMGEQQQEAKRALQPLLAAGTQCRTHAAPLVLTGLCATKGQAQSPNIPVAGGEHPSPKPSAGLHRAGLGCRGCWVPDTPFAVFGLQGNRRKKNPRLREKKKQA